MSLRTGLSGWTKDVDVTADAIKPGGLPPKPATVVTIRTTMINGGHLNGPIVRGAQIYTQALSVDERRKSSTLHWLPWRSDGSKIFACVDPEDTEGINDIEVGSMLTDVMAGEVIMAHNAALRDVDADA